MSTPPQFLDSEITYGVEPNHALACYLRGTRILTPKGEVAIENLAIGDEVLTASGACRPVRWLGFRRVNCTKHPQPDAVWPVLVRAGAFADGAPRRDLWLSRKHAVFVDGALIPVEKLINESTIVQLPRSEVEYWHVELDAHDIVLAEGLAAESYLDTGNRTAFINGGAFIEAHPDFTPRHWADTCVPLVLKGPVLEAAKRGLEDRAAALGDAVPNGGELPREASRAG